jgi:hypothetical protein
MNVLTPHNQKHLITVSCFMLLILGVVSYMYFLSLSVVHVVMRKEVLQETQQLRSEIAFLESSYIEAHHAISQRVSTASGFSAVQDKIFIQETDDTALVLRTQGE